MKKKILIYCLKGLPIGISIGYIISIIISLFFRNGNYYPCVPELEYMMGSQINAVIFQTVLTGIIGMTFSACSLIWNIDSWSMLKQTSVYFIITAAVMISSAYWLYWMKHNLISITIFSLIYIIIFFAVWMLQYLVYKHSIKKINAMLK